MFFTHIHEQTIKGSFVKTTVMISEGLKISSIYEIVQVFPCFSSFVELHSLLMNEVNWFGLLHAPLDSNFLKIL